MAKCEKCGAELSAGDVFCGECGAKVEPQQEEVQEEVQEEYRPNSKAQKEREAYEFDRKARRFAGNTLHFIRRQFINLWCLVGILLLYDLLFGACRIENALLATKIGRHLSFIKFPALIFLPYWLFFSGYPERNNNLKLLPLFFALWSGAALYVHFKYGASLKTMGLLILAGVAVYTLTIIKSFKHVKPKLIVGVLAVIVVVLMLFVHRGSGGNIVFHLP